VKDTYLCCAKLDPKFSQYPCGAGSGAAKKLVKLAINQKKEKDYTSVKVIDVFF
jgi:hypothetical protein